MKRPLISIIIPAYNVERYISHGIESCIDQTYSNIEVIIVDDGSTDNTYEIIKRYKKDHRIKSIKKDNSGVSSARNCALSVSGGDFILFLDSDDWLENDAVENLVSVALTHNSHLVCADRFFASIDKNGKIDREDQTHGSGYKYVDVKDGLLNVGTGLYNLQSSCYKLYESSIIKEHCIQFDENIYHGEDGLFVFEYMKYISGFIYIYKPLWNILERPGSATMSGYNSKWLSMMDALDCMIEQTTENDVIEKLKIYKAERAVILARTFYRYGGINNEDCVRIKNIMRYLIAFYCTGDRQLIDKIKYLAFTYIPMPLMKLFMKVKTLDYND